MSSRDKGAHFHRCDFQVHTPRDNQWKGGRAGSSDERDAYARRFVAACRTAGLHAVAITDHHDFVFAPHIRRAATEEVDALGDPLPPEDHLIVFPGLELTLGVPCQAILLLDADVPDERLTDVLHALSIDPHDAEATSLPPVARLDHFTTLQEVHDALDLKEYLRGRYILFPNVTDKGHGTLMRTGMANKYRDMPCVGGYLDGTVEKKVGEGNRKIFAGLDKSRNHKRLALFQTSDSRNEDFSTLGVPSTWVKWAIPSAEALRQACLAEESRITHQLPSLPTSFIDRISVSNSLFMGPIDLRLNPQYNAVIGGRGTGKSTILDYLRWAMSDAIVHPGEGEEAGDPMARRRRLIEATLVPVDATVEVHLQINDIPHVVRRSAATGEQLLKIGDAAFQNVSEVEVRELLPIQGYSQKQLSSVAVRVDELMRFVTSPIRRELAQLRRSSDELANELRDSYSAVRRHRSLAADVRRLEQHEKSLLDQAANLRSSLPEMSGADAAVLAEKPEYDRHRTAHEQVGDSYLAARRAADDAVQQLDRILGNMPEPPDGDSDACEAVTAEIEAARSTITALREHLVGRVAVLSSGEAEAGASVAARVESLLASFDDAYAEVKARSAAHETKLQELTTVEEQQAHASRDLQTRRRELADLGDPESSLRSDLEGLFESYERRSDALAAQCAGLSSQSDGLLKATLRRGQGLDAVREGFRTAVAGSGLRGARIDGFFDELRGDDDPMSTWRVVLTELEALASIEDPARVTTELVPTVARLGLQTNELRRVSDKLTPDGWLLFATTPIEDHPEFEYRTKENEYIAFADASAGQQATALMRVLLGQPGPPLVIDQPEDDLDSQVVQNVVERIWQAKQRRQLIFASHNANLVVNGDAELVVCCDYRRAGDQSGGTIRLEGAIDVPGVRAEVTRIMEGGEKAFRLRKEKYGF